MYSCFHLPHIWLLQKPRQVFFLVNQHRHFTPSLRSVIDLSIPRTLPIKLSLFPAQHPLWALHKEPNLWYSCWVHFWVENCRKCKSMCRKYMGCDDVFCKVAYELCSRGLHTNPRVVSCFIYAELLSSLFLLHAVYDK